MGYAMGLAFQRSLQSVPLTSNTLEDIGAVNTLEDIGALNTLEDIAA